MLYHPLDIAARWGCVRLTSISVWSVAKADEMIFVRLVSKVVINVEFLVLGWCRNTAPFVHQCPSLWLRASTNFESKYVFLLDCVNCKFQCNLVVIFVSFVLEDYIFMQVVISLFWLANYVNICSLNWVLLSEFFL